MTSTYALLISWRFGNRFSVTITSMPTIITNILRILSFNESSSNKTLATFASKISPTLGSYIYCNKKINNNLSLLTAYLTANARLYLTCS